jgi:hypothetical protein
VDEQAQDAGNNDQRPVTLEIGGDAVPAAHHLPGRPVHEALALRGRGRAQRNADSSARERSVAVLNRP